MPVKSTYNFVPAPNENEVFKPDWANEVSHDIPFSDGESGEIELTITAETPIFIRNGHKCEVEENEFSHYLDESNKKQYFIPGTSLKGMFRNVLEMMTMSRMKQVNDHRHSVRQIMKTQGNIIDEGYELTGEEKKKILAGYLIYENGKYNVYSCGKPLKIRYTDIDVEYKKNFANQFGGRLLSNMNEDFSAKTAKYKYELLDGEILEKIFIKHPREEEKQSSWVSGFQPLHYAKFAEYGDADIFDGTIVCVGQATNYNVSTSRKGEYVFVGKKSEIIKNEKLKYIVSENVIDTFKFINRDNKGENEELVDWAYWKEKIQEGIPVFFRPKEENGVKRVLDLGLSFMYKQPVKYSVKEVQKLNNKNNAYGNSEPDFAETLFGSTTNNESLKGRIIFANFNAKGTPIESNLTKFLLASPRSSYVPFYLKQNGINGQTSSFNTFNNNPELRGYKKYPTHNKEKFQDTSSLSEKMLSKLIPLESKTVFKGKIRFHNLRKIEIGALLSAITLHNSQDTYHSLGNAKSFGYGRIKITIASLKNLQYEYIEYLKEFEATMRAVNSNWEVALQELLTMATLQSQQVERNLTYMDLTDFQIAKNNGYFLQSYSAIASNIKNIVRIASDEDVALVQMKLIERKEEIKKAAENKLLEENLAKEAESNRLKAEADSIVEKELLEAISSNSKQVLDAFILKHRGSTFVIRAEEKLAEIKNEEKAKSQINILSAKFEFANFKYDTIKSLVNPLYAKLKGATFSEAQIESLINAIKQSFILENLNIKKSVFYKKGQLVKLNDHPWREIARWLGETKAKELYLELTNPEREV